jgi:2-oxoglutarate/2-oxoacid ferredoxin oxidoreductase subunit alpha
MVRLRQAKIDGITVPNLVVDDPPPAGAGGTTGGGACVLALGWGSSYGPIGAACRRVRNEGLPIAQAHLRYLNPLPANLGEILRRYDKIVVPEMNLGQLALLLQAKYLVDIHSHTKIAGLPFKAEELQQVFTAVLKGEVTA